MTRRRRTIGREAAPPIAAPSLSLDIAPGLYAVLPGWLRPLFESSLTLSTVVAVLLNQLLRGGAAPSARPPAPAE